ncbi:MAG TPA: rhodanese-like domain-containing protein, partial [Saprospiraceae bacterium]|nr:rhodanese-like domain-containing protein [Saprospiraceae bacterium]
GAQIIDVRTSGEFDHGHIQGAINIPVQQLQLNLAKIRKDRPVITCCASGIRSAKAKRILLSSGYQDVYNGGGWSDLQKQIR